MCSALYARVLPLTTACLLQIVTESCLRPVINCGWDRPQKSTCLLIEAITHREHHLWPQCGYLRWIYLIVELRMRRSSWSSRFQSLHRIKIHHLSWFCLFWQVHINSAVKYTVNLQFSLFGSITISDLAFVRNLRINQIDTKLYAGFLNVNKVSSKREEQLFEMLRRSKWWSPR
jgi:hypothetical protein